MNTEKVNLMTKNLVSSLQTQFRGAVQCFLAETLINLLDTAEVVPQTLFPMLIVWRSDESLRRGTKLWSNLTSWFKSICPKEKQWNLESINEYLSRGFSKIISGNKPHYNFKSDISLLLKALLKVFQSFQPHQEISGSTLKYIEFKFK